jgi:hypothetical protein
LSTVPSASSTLTDLQSISPPAVRGRQRGTLIVSVVAHHEDAL